jgi:uncharacterized protein YkwD
MEILTLLFLINLIRTEPLVLDADLSHRASIRAQVICHDTKLVHDNYLDSFVGIKGAKGENLASGFRTEVEMFLALYKSPTHRENMQRDVFTRVGIANGCGKTVFLFN